MYFYFDNNLILKWYRYDAEILKTTDKCKSFTSQNKSISFKMSVVDYDHTFDNSNLNNYITIDKNIESKYDLYLLNSSIETINNFKNTQIFNINIINYDYGSYEDLNKMINYLNLIKSSYLQDKKYVIIANGDLDINLPIRKFLQLINWLTLNIDTYEIFNGTPYLNHYNNFKDVKFYKSLNPDLLFVNYIKGLKFNIINTKCIHKLINLLEVDIITNLETYIYENFMQLIYKDQFLFHCTKKSSLQSDYLEEYTLNRYINTIVPIKKIPIIGIYSIFIGKYICLYENFIKNMEKYFLPQYEKVYFIVTDDLKLNKYVKNTYISYQNYIGWPYETLYRFHYFLKFDINNIKTDYIYFFNSNARCVKRINEDILPEKDYVFSIHDCQGLSGYDATFEKNITNSTAYVPFVQGKKYTYIGGRLFGATSNKFIELCEILKNNITKDEKNNIIAEWHDESHINNYYNCYLNDYDKHNSKLLPREYHVPEERIHLNKDPKIIYLYKNKFSINKTYTNIRFGKVISTDFNKI